MKGETELVALENTNNNAGSTAPYIYIISNY